jgi:broad specificity phosphatase PhoE
MQRRAYFVTHPNVVIDPALPVPEWPLSELGKTRVQAGLHQPWIDELSAIYTSAERKALDTAEILAAHLHVTYSVLEELGENDRSATGFLPPPEFERMADAFFVGKLHGTHSSESLPPWQRSSRPIAHRGRSPSCRMALSARCCTVICAACL